jgi:hypothetical protein
MAARWRAYDAGVTDVVGPSGAERREPTLAWASVPTLARTFIVLTVLAVIVRSLWALLVHMGTTDGGGPFQAPLDLGDLFILLPAVVVLRRRTAAADTPWVIRGTVVLAAFTIISGALGPFLFPSTVFEPLFIPTSAQFIESVVQAVGWIAIGYGLSRLNPAQPAPVAAGLANLAGGALLLAALALTVDSLVSIAMETFVRLNVGSSLLSTGAAALSLLSLGYLARCVARGFDDPGRPERATRLATAAVLLLGLGQVLATTLSAIEELTGFRGIPTDLFQAFGYTWDIALAMLVVSFALGLADPLRPLPKDWAAAGTS